MDELIGRTNTAIHTLALCFGSSKLPVKDKTLSKITGIQQKKSVKTIMNSLVALVDSVFAMCLAVDLRRIKLKMEKNMRT